MAYVGDLKEQKQNMPKEDPREAIDQEEVLKIYRMLIYVLFIRFKDFLAINPKGERLKYEVLPSIRWFKSPSRKLYSFLWICETLGFNSNRMLATFKKMKKGQIDARRINYDRFCEILLEIREGKREIHASDEDFLIGSPLQKRIAILANKESMDEDEWMYDKLFNRGWTNLHFALVLDTNPENVSSFLRRNWRRYVN